MRVFFLQASQLSFRCDINSMERKKTRLEKANAVWTALSWSLIGHILSSPMR